MADVSFPTMRYAPFEDPKMIETAEELAALGPEWKDTPYTDEEKREYQNQQVQQARPPESPPETGGSEGETTTAPRRR